MMRRSWLIGFLLLSFSGPASQSLADEGKAKPRAGMTADETRKLLGPPKRISRQILYRRYLEQWTYDEPIVLRIEFNCVRGEESKIVSVHPLRSEKP
jgi:hypothetical protein